MQALLQVYYVLVAIHGWRHWGAAGTSAELPVSRWQLSAHLAALAALAILVLGTVLIRDTPGDLRATLDAATSWGSVLATWMVAQKKLDAWLYWIVIDALSVILYLQAGLMATAALYLLYTVLAVLGWFQWQSNSLTQNSN
jgi:nicotinamide mononucleotide transporter